MKTVIKVANFFWSRMCDTLFFVVVEFPESLQSFLSAFTINYYGIVIHHLHDLFQLLCDCSIAAMYWCTHLVHLLALNLFTSNFLRLLWKPIVFL